MQYFYRQPALDLQDYFGSFYFIGMPQAGEGCTRVEAPHLRFILAGVSTLTHGEEVSIYEAPAALVCGPSFRAGHAAVTAGSIMIGASITPLGWQALFGVSAEDYGDRKAPLSDRIGDAPDIDRWCAETRSGDEAAFMTLEDILRAYLNRESPVRRDFLDVAMDWALDPSSPSIETLVERTGLSHRQVDRLCRQYFGGSPKQVHRVYRALNVAYRLASDPTLAWNDVAGAFHDQAHFSKDFKDRLGCRPSEFMNGQIMMMRFDIEKRLEIPHKTRFSLLA